MSFFDMMQKELNNRKTLTSNGAVTYATSGKKILDFNFGISAMRTMDPEKIADKFMGVYYEDKLRAMEYLFYLADIREGLGERNAFRSCLLWLVRNQPGVANAVAELIPYYNRWDSILVLLADKKTRQRAIEVIKLQLVEDITNMAENKPISLLAKWMPSINASSKVTKNLARQLCEALGLTEKEYRKTLSALRKYLDVVEVKMSAKQWGEIDYEKVPSKANLNYNNAFLRNDEERRRAFLAALKSGNAKINAGTLQPHEICTKYRMNGFSYYSNRGIPVDDTLEELWKALPDLSVENTLIIRDGSGSMMGGGYGGNAVPLDVATALAIYMSERNTGAWKDKFITFSANPKIIDLHNCRTLAEKLTVTYREDDCSNTNIYKTMRLVLDTAKKNHLTQEEMPGMIVICSDMAFDGSRFNFNQTLFEEISQDFKAAGYKLPKICFWNIAGENGAKGGVPMQQNEMGLVLCSGFSVQLLRMFMSNEVDPYKILLETLDSPRYDKVREAVKDLV